MPSWELYSYFYSLSLRNLLPYQQLLEDLNNVLDIKEGDSVLDAGCGPGLVIERIIRANEGKNLSVTGLDLSKRMISRARGRCDNSSIRFLVTDLNRPLEFPESSFDRVVCSNTLYILEDPRSVIGEFHRVLKQGGILIIANPKPNANERQLVRAHISAINRMAPMPRKIYHIVTSILLIPVHLAVIAINGAIVRRGRSREYHFWSKDELERVLQEAGFRSINTCSCYADQDWLVTAEK
jgi:ubiquinone/menaquinone biosynthesis C-methylase UbiE